MAQQDGVLYPGNYRGKVLDNNDPSQLGRIKVEVYPMMLGTATAKAFGDPESSIATADIPWAIPAMPLFSGAGDGTGAFAVPDIDSYVWIFFECSDIYQPVFFAEAQNGLRGLPSERATDYPNTKVFKTASGISITINQLEGSEDIKITHPAGSTVQIDSSGNMTFTVAALTTITSTGNVQITAPRIDLN